MSRSTLLQTYRPPKPRKFTVKEVAEMLRREVKRRAIADGHIYDPRDRLPKWEWHWRLNGEGGMVRANTKGEAISLIRGETGLKKLPPEIEVMRVRPECGLTGDVHRFVETLKAPEKTSLRDGPVGSMGPCGGPVGVGSKSLNAWGQPRQSPPGTIGFSGEPGPAGSFGSHIRR